MNETNNLSCFSLFCPFTSKSKAEMEKHEQEHKVESEKLAKEINLEDDSINEADLDYLEGLRTKMSEVIDVRKIGGENKEVWLNKMIEGFLQEQWGSPVDEIQTNLLLELQKKIFSYYGKDPFDNNITVYNFIGSVDSISDIVEKKFKEGQKFVFKYKKRGKDNQIIDFYPYENDNPKKVEPGNNSTDSLQSKLNEKNSDDPTQALG
ncbi:14254_t:CDS:2 [Funneliformis geosporum]|nr:14254_t:CDS:2 [Funneliformis geosporum]